MVNTRITLALLALVVNIYALPAHSVERREALSTLSDPAQLSNPDQDLLKGEIPKSRKPTEQQLPSCTIACAGLNCPKCDPSLRRPSISYGKPSDNNDLANSRKPTGDKDDKHTPPDFTSPYQSPPIQKRSAPVIPAYGTIVPRADKYDIGDQAKDEIMNSLPPQRQSSDLTTNAPPQPDPSSYAPPPDSMEQYTSPPIQKRSPEPQLDQTFDDYAGPVTSGVPPIARGDVGDQAKAEIMDAPPPMQQPESSPNATPQPPQLTGYETPPDSMEQYASPPIQKRSPEPQVDQAFDDYAGPVASGVPPVPRGDVGDQAKAEIMNSPPPMRQPDDTSFDAPLAQDPSMTYPPPSGTYDSPPIQKRSAMVGPNNPHLEGMRLLWESQVEGGDPAPEPAKPSTPKAKRDAVLSMNTEGPSTCLTGVDCAKPNDIPSDPKPFKPVSRTPDQDRKTAEFLQQMNEKNRGQPENSGAVTITKRDAPKPPGSNGEMSESERACALNGCSWSGPYRGPSIPSDAKLAPLPTAQDLERGSEKLKKARACGISVTNAAGMAACEKGQGQGQVVAAPGMVEKPSTPVAKREAPAWRPGMAQDDPARPKGAIVDDGFNVAKFNQDFHRRREQRVGGEGDNSGRQSGGSTEGGGGEVRLAVEPY
ncbi:hypothetical protein C1H76_3973 [Elsinoe australis]|uniref:Uncharacterized protein n=1 Tax=Elsinoe australis TaxID=40998 RepID=A0A4U7B6I9_9PEZI|nr:hypothetical protein C1H76_3973 [Elsinoe australis]